MSEFEVTETPFRVFPDVTLSDEIILVVNAKIEKTKNAMVNKIARFITV